MNLDSIREVAINNLFILLNDNTLNISEKKTIASCATLLANRRTPEQIERLEKKLFSKINGVNNG